MKPGPIIAVIIVLAYVGFEAFAISKAAYRLEPVYIFERFVEVDRAMSRCGEPSADMQNRFARNRSSVRRNAELDMAKQNPSEAPEVIDRLLTEMVQRQQSAVDRLITEVGCGDIEIFKLTKGYENRARLNLPAPAQASGR